MKKPELVAPAGDLEKLKVAFHFGADAVYVGLKNFSLRAQAKNFTSEELEEAIHYTHSLGKKIYITLNIYFYPSEIEKLIDVLKILNNLKVDGIIISDLGALNLAIKYAKDIPIHISTQANICNHYAINLLKNFNVKRIILSRELTLDEIKKIREKTDIELETFVHGAMCISYSGRCLLSAYMTHPDLGKKVDIDTPIRSANQGDCAHSCRWEYFLIEKSRASEIFEIIQEEKASYILSSKDLCMIYNISDLVNAGIDAFKIEGRMKSILYVASIVRIYRAAIDHFFDNSVYFDKTLIDKELESVSHRQFCTGFFYISPQKNAQINTTGMYKRETRLAAMVNEIREDKVFLKIYNSFSIDDKIEHVYPGIKTNKVKKALFYDENGELLTKLTPNKKVNTYLWDENGEKINLSLFDILRIEANF